MKRKNVSMYILIGLGCWIITCLGTDSTQVTSPTTTPNVLLIASTVTDPNPANCQWQYGTANDSSNNGSLTLTGCLGVGGCSQPNTVTSGSAIQKFTCPANMVPTETDIRYYNTATQTWSGLQYFDQRVKVLCCPLVNIYKWAPVPPTCSASVTVNCVQ